MQLRVTTESDTFVYATSQISLGGLAPEDMLFFLIPTAASNSAGFPPLLAFAFGGFCLWLFKKLTRNQPEGFLVLITGARAAKILQVPLVANNPGLFRFFNTMLKAINQIWIKSGLLPSPHYCNLYER